MCTGLEIAALLGSAVLSAGGTAYAQNEASSNAAAEAAARNRELNLTLDRNDKLADEARKTYDTREEEIQPKNLRKDQAEATADRTQTLESAVAPAEPGSIALSGSAPEVVRTEIAKRMGGTMREGIDSAKRLGKLGGYTDSLFNQDVANNAAGRDIGVTQNAVAGNMALLPYAQDFAGYQARKPSSGIGEVVAAGGQALGAAAGSGALAPGGRTASYLSQFKMPRAGVVF